VDTPQLICHVPVNRQAQATCRGRGGGSKMPATGPLAFNSCHLKQDKVGLRAGPREGQQVNCYRNCYQAPCS